MRWWQHKRVRRKSDGTEGKIKGFLELGENAAYRAPEGWNKVSDKDGSCLALIVLDNGQTISVNLRDYDPINENGMNPQEQRIFDEGFAAGAAYSKGGLDAVAGQPVPDWIDSHRTSNRELLERSGHEIPSRYAKYDYTKERDNADS